MQDNLANRAQSSFYFKYNEADLQRERGEWVLQRVLALFNQGISSECDPFCKLRPVEFGAPSGGRYLI